MADADGPWSPEQAEAALQRAREGPATEPGGRDGGGGRPWGRTLGALAAAVVGIVYLVNPTAGLIELLPDVWPVVGNLDEAGATMLVFYALRYLVRGGREGDVPWPPPRG